MSGLLVSVKSLEEAKSILSCGVDIIDMKDPADGALGALEPSDISKIVETIGGKAKTSATIGNLEPDALELADKIRYIASTGVDYVKVGLFSDRESQQFIHSITQNAIKGVNIIIVLFAEHYISENIIDSLVGSNIKGVMLDTLNKNDGSLQDKLSAEVIKQFVTKAKHHELITGLAGSLSINNIETFKQYETDYLGFRGALCDASQRENTINIEQLKQIQTILKA